MFNISQSKIFFFILPGPETYRQIKQKSYSGAYSLHFQDSQAEFKAKKTLKIFFAFWDKDLLKDVCSGVVYSLTENERKKESSRVNMLAI